MNISIYFEKSDSQYLLQLDTNEKYIVVDKYISLDNIFHILIFDLIKERYSAYWANNDFKDRIISLNKITKSKPLNIYIAQNIFINYHFTGINYLI